VLEGTDEHSGVQIPPEPKEFILFLPIGIRCSAAGYKMVQPLSLKCASQHKMSLIITKKMETLCNKNKLMKDEHLNKNTDFPLLP
jgi:hypothetical protein